MTSEKVMENAYFEKMQIQDILHQKQLFSLPISINPIQLQVPFAIILHPCYPFPHGALSG